MKGTCKMNQEKKDFIKFKLDELKWYVDHIDLVDDDLDDLEDYLFDTNHTIALAYTKEILDYLKNNPGEEYGH